MKFLFSRIALLAVLGAFINSAAAGVIYSYVGSSPLVADMHCAPTNEYYNECLVVPAGLNMGAMQASFSFDESLAANLSNMAVTPQAWSVSANGSTLTNASAGYRLEYQDFSAPVGLPVGLLASPSLVYDAMLVSTDSNGAITEWQFAVRASGWREGDSYPGMPFSAYEPLRIASASDATHMVTDPEFQECTTFPCVIPTPTEPRPVFVPGTDTLQFAAATSAFLYGHANATSGSTGSWTATVIPVPAAAWLFISALGVVLGLRRKR
jgi:hypothetical protein